VDPAVSVMTAYSLAAMQKTGGQWVTAPQYASSAADANPETIYFKLRSDVTASKVRGSIFQPPARRGMAR
jgi:hypothetical protein